MPAGRRPGGKMMRTATRGVAAFLVLALLFTGSVASPFDESARGAPDRTAAALRERLAATPSLDLRPVADELELLEPGEKVEQLRDWALLAAVGQLKLDGPGVDWYRLVGGLPPDAR